MIEEIVNFEKIIKDLETKANRKRDIKVTRLNAEIKAADTEAEAYFNGAYDALEMVKSELTAQQKQKDSAAG